jgi:hypothetical protein
MWVLSFRKLGGEVDGRIEGIVAGLRSLVMGIPPKKKKEGGVFICLIPLGVEQSWQGDFLSLARNFSWMHYAGAEHRKGIEESY